MSMQVPRLSPGQRHAGLTWFQRSCLIAGLVLLSFFAIAQIDARLGAASGLADFSAMQQLANGLDVAQVRQPDLSLWADGRIEAYRQSLTASAGSPTGVLRIPGLSLEVPIFDGTNDLVLNRGVGRIEGTAMPGEPGNLGIAGHRDGFFRVLKDIEKGDLISVEYLEGRIEYRVTETFIVDPDETWVLGNSGEEMVTLVTCYPFYFVGHAPQRFIVRGVEATGEGAGA
jgi:sortase A